jgi:hypothetical protein
MDDGCCHQMQEISMHRVSFSNNYILPSIHTYLSTQFRGTYWTPLWTARWLGCPEIPWLSKVKTCNQKHEYVRFKNRHQKAFDKSNLRVNLLKSMSNKQGSSNGYKEKLISIVHGTKNWSTKPAEHRKKALQLVRCDLLPSALRDSQWVTDPIDLRNHPVSDNKGYY